MLGAIDEVKLVAIVAEAMSEGEMQSCGCNREDVDACV